MRTMYAQFHIFGSVFITFRDSNAFIDFGVDMGNDFVPVLFTLSIMYVWRSV